MHSVHTLFPAAIWVIAVLAPCVLLMRALPE